MTQVSARRKIRILKKKYLVEREEKGGTAKGFVDYILDISKPDNDEWRIHYLELIGGMARQVWEEQPRKAGPDLFVLAGFPLSETFTRPASYRSDMDDLSNADQREEFEKVDQQFATLSDLADDTTIKFRKAAQASAVAEEQAKALNEGRRRANGDMSTKLSDVKD